MNEKLFPVFSNYLFFSCIFIKVLKAFTHSQIPTKNLAKKNVYRKSSFIVGWRKFSVHTLFFPTDPQNQIPKMTRKLPSWVILNMYQIIAIMISFTIKHWKMENHQTLPRQWSKNFPLIYKGIFLNSHTKFSHNIQKDFPEIWIKWYLKKYFLFIFHQKKPYHIKKEHNLFP